MSINRTYGNIAGFWVITRKPCDEKRAITQKWVIRFTSKLQGR
jgi:hypothetical protein